MERQDTHLWVRRRLVARRAGLLEESEAARVDAHLAECVECSTIAESFAASPPGEAGAHIAASLVAQWPQAQRRLRGLERALVRRHLERCADCRQDLEALGFESRLELVPEWESAVPAEPAPVAASASATGAAAPARARIVRIEAAARRSPWRDRAVLAWASVATAAAVLMLVANVRGRLFDSGAATLLVPGAPVWSRGALASGPFAGMSLRIEPQPRALSGPARGEGLGKLNVIPVAGPLSSLALGFKPLNVPDTSLVTVSLLDAFGDTLYAVSYRQWEFRPRRCLVIDRGEATLTPGQYALVLGSQIAKAGDEIERKLRYRFELREK
ncbi:MAG: zf-HC2 domain-containing protein [Deltaproteobacteria bacterium]|nr:MAG: zf-HC2 domain-containing protein [Deltaproteobacteria bacterium]